MKCLRTSCRYNISSYQNFNSIINILLLPRTSIKRILFPNFKLLILWQKLLVVISLCNVRWHVNDVNLIILICVIFSVFINSIFTFVLILKIQVRLLWFLLNIHARALLQEWMELLTSSLCKFCMACLATGYITESWRAENLVFKTNLDWDSSKGRSCSLINLLWWTWQKNLLKNTLRKLLWNRGHVTKISLTLVTKVEYSLGNKEIAIVFFYIGYIGVFDDTFNSLFRTVRQHVINETFFKWVKFTLTVRSINSTNEVSFTKVTAAKGFPLERGFLTNFKESVLLQFLRNEAPLSNAMRTTWS